MDTTDWAHTGTAAAQRAEKIRRLVAVLLAAKCDPSTAARLDAKGRRTAEKAAGVHRGSDETWAGVITALRVEHARYTRVTSRTVTSTGTHPDKVSTTPCEGCLAADGRGPVLDAGHPGAHRPCPTCSATHSWWAACVSVHART